MYNIYFFETFWITIRTNNMGVNVFDQFTEDDCRSLMGCMKKVLFQEKPNERDIAHFLFKYTEELYKFSKGRNGKIGDLSCRFKDKWGE